MSFYELVEKIHELEHQGKRIIKLNIGDTRLPQPQVAVDAVAKFLKDKKAEYVSAAGLPEFRERLAAREGCKVENILVGSGSKILLYGLLSILPKPGDRVMFPAPYWPAYPQMCVQLQMKADILKTKLEDKWLFDVNTSLKDVSAFILCNPLNPTSTIYSPELVNKMLSEAERNGCRLILDEAYRGLAFEEIPMYNTIRVRSFSKEFNMEGWRLAYIVAPADIVKKMTNLFNIMTTCTPPFVQAAGMACLEHEKEILAENVAIWKKRVAFSSKVLREAGFKFADPRSGMYVFATHDQVSDAGKFSMQLLDKGVAIAPGASFGDYPDFFRICLNQPDDLVEEAVAKMKECLEVKVG